MLIYTNKCPWDGLDEFPPESDPIREKVIQWFVEFVNENVELEEDVYLVSMMDLLPRERMQLFGTCSINRSLRDRRKRRRLKRERADRHSSSRAGSLPFGVVSTDIFNEQSSQIHGIQNMVEEIKTFGRRVYHRSIRWMMVD